MLAQREQWKQKMKQTRKEVYNLPFVKPELEKCSFKYKILTQKYRDICIDIHTRSFMTQNGVSQVHSCQIRWIFYRCQRRSNGDVFADFLCHRSV